jgi:hypothetical protein
VIFACRWHKPDFIIIPVMNKTTRQYAFNADLPWMDGSMMTLRGEQSCIVDLNLGMSMKSADPDVHFSSQDKSIDQPALSS